MINNEIEFNRWLPAGFDGEFDWDFLLPAWIPTKIEPSDIDAAMVSGEASDIDAVVERKRNVLLFETKRAGTNVKFGSSRTMDTFIALGAVAIHVEGKTPKDITGFSIYKPTDDYQQFGTKPIKPKTSLDLVFECRQWFLWANGMLRQSREEWELSIWDLDYDRGLGAELNKKAIPWCEWCRSRIRND